MATPRKGKIEETPGYCKAEDLANLFALVDSITLYRFPAGVSLFFSTPSLVS